VSARPTSTMTPCCFIALSASWVVLRAAPDHAAVKEFAVRDGLIPMGEPSQADQQREAVGDELVLRRRAREIAELHGRGHQLAGLEEEPAVPNGRFEVAKAARAARQRCPEVGERDVVRMPTPGAPAGDPEAGLRVVPPERRLSGVPRERTREPLARGVDPERGQRLDQGTVMGATPAVLRLPRAASFARPSASASSTGSIAFSVHAASCARARRSCRRR
jgi:hypothetical protein